MKIYTRKGDQGYTSLLGGTKVPKSSHRIDAYGTVDELNSHIGLVRDVTQDEHQRHLLQHIQSELFTIGSMLATDPQKSKVKLPELKPQLVDDMERAMDQMDEQLPELKSFILPGGHAHSSYCHIARTVCRRAERLCVALAEEQPIHEAIIPFLNRLSDYLFVLARKINQDEGGEEVKWVS